MGKPDEEVCASMRQPDGDLQAMAEKMVKEIQPERVSVRGIPSKPQRSHERLTTHMPSHRRRGRDKQTVNGHLPPPKKKIFKEAKNEDTSPYPLPNTTPTA